MLAYSSIAQAGYILIGVATVSTKPGPLTLTFNGINGVLIYLMAYLVTNLAAFAVVIAVENRSGTVEIKDYAGIIRHTPVLAVALFIFLLSLAGIPPTGRFHRQGVRLRRHGASRDDPPGGHRRAQLGRVRFLLLERRALHVLYAAGAGRRADGSRSNLSLQGAVLLTGTLTLLIGLFPGPLIDWATRSVQLLALR